MPVPGQPAIRPGLSTVRNLGGAPAAAIEAGQPYADLADFARRTSLPVPAMEALATAGHGVSRRDRPALTPATPHLASARPQPGTAGSRTGRWAAA